LGFTIREGLALQDPDNALWQRNLGLSYTQIGGALELQGDLAGASTVFRKALVIMEVLAAQDSTNVDFQHGMGSCYNRIGGILETQGYFGGALNEYRKAQSIIMHLTELDPDNPEWQSNLSSSYLNCADTALAGGDPTEALTYATQAVALSRQYAPDAESPWHWRHSLAISLRRLAAAHLALQQSAAALSTAVESLATLDVRDAEEPGSEDGPRCRIQGLLAHIHTALGDTPAARSAWAACQETLTRMAATKPLDAEESALLAAATAALAQP
jgi:tetratricopeptide (TPR) repeat protein